MKILREFFIVIRDLFIHKCLVFYKCNHLGIPWRGLIHDWSKLRWSELYYYVFDPVLACEIYQRVGTIHHARNAHHWQHWVKRVPHWGDVPGFIPRKYVLEMYADWWATARQRRRPLAEWWAKAHMVTMADDSRASMESLIARKA